MIGDFILFKNFMTVIIKHIEKYIRTLHNTRKTFGGLHEAFLFGTRVFPNYEE